MSIMGTSLAAGVAQTTHNAQQVARQQDKRRNDAARGTREVRDRYEQLIQGLEESADATTAARVAIDDRVPDSPDHAADAADDEAEHDEADTPADELAPPPHPLHGLARSAEAMALRQRLTGQHDAALYRHLDLEA